MLLTYYKPIDRVASDWLDSVRDFKTISQSWKSPFNMKKIRHLISVKEIYVVCGFNRWDVSITNFFIQKKRKKKLKNRREVKLFIFMMIPTFGTTLTLHCCKSNPRAHSALKMGEDITVKVSVAHLVLKMWSNIYKSSKVFIFFVSSSPYHTFFRF